MNHAPYAGEGRVIELDYAPMHNGSADIHILRNYALNMLYILLSARMTL